MKSTKHRAILMVAATLAVSAATFAYTHFRGTNGAEKVFNASWYVAHTPDNPRLVNQAKEFARKLEARSQGRLHLELKFPDPTQRDGNNFRTAVEKIKTNEAQISQISTQALTSFDTQFMVFDLPFLFQSHEHAASVFDGQIGAGLKEHLLIASNNVVRPLSFTYSGGYRVFMSTKPISKMSDLAGLKMHSYGVETTPKKLITEDSNLVRLETYLALKMQPVSDKAHPDYVSQLEFLKHGDVTMTEDHFSHYTRLFNKFGTRAGLDYVWETKHSLFLTSIVVNEEFFKSLPSDLQAILKEEAQTLALVEREDSIFTDQKAKKQMLEAGIKITPLSDDERAKMLEATHIVYEKLEAQIGTKLVEDIKRLAPAPTSGTKISDSRD